MNQKESGSAAEIVEQTQVKEMPQDTSEDSDKEVAEAVNKKKRASEYITYEHKQEKKKKRVAHRKKAYSTRTTHLQSIFDDFPKGLTP